MANLVTLEKDSPWAGGARRARWADFTAYAGCILFSLTSFYALFLIGADRDQGNVYRILFVHVPCAWNAFFWLLVGACAALRTLMAQAKNQGVRVVRWDATSHAAMELGTVFGALTLITGSIWGRPTWGVWWDWDPRLTSTLVLFLVCCAYLLLREFTPDLQARRKLSAVLSLLAAVNVPLVYFSVNLWRSLHQPQTFVRRQVTASDSITLLLWASVCALVLWAWGLFRVRRQALLSADAVEQAFEEGDSYGPR